VALLPGLVPAALAKKKPRPEQALIAGTVFRPDGRSLPGATIEVSAESSGGKKLRASTDQRGEFAVRVPAGQALYRVTARAKGFGTAEKAVEVFSDEKVRANFVLSPE
jgi:hypothetical protein